MKCIAFVDLHGNRKAYDNLKKKIKKEKPDFLICAGDITIFENSLKQLMYKLSKFNGRVFIIHGNHEEAIVMRNLANQYKNIEFIHGRVVEYNDLILVGWGGGGFTIRDVEFEAFARSVKKDLKRYKKEGKKIIFVGHAPFYKTELDFLEHGHFGNKSFANFIKEFRVDFGFCGHLHENSGKEDMIRDCKVYNPGPGGKVVKV